MPTAPDRNARFTVAYDGTDFRGFAISAGVRSVLGELTTTLERIVRVPVELTGSGRTDAGVHAWGQVVTGRLPVETDLDRVTMSVNQMLRPEVALRDPAWVDDDFSARFSATSRSYRYEVWNDPAPNPLLARHVWHVGRSLDIESMNRAAADLVGDHDFSSFCRRPKPGPGYDEPRLVRRLLAARWERVEGSALLRFEITATSFCHQMVRSIVGTLVDVGAGRRTADSIPATLAALDRNSAGQVAPPTGLTLWAVSFEGARWDA